MAKNTSQTQITRALVGFDSGSIGPFELCNAGEYRGNYGPPETWRETKIAMIKFPHFQQAILIYNGAQMVHSTLPCKFTREEMSGVLISFSKWWEDWTWIEFLTFSSRFFFAPPEQQPMHATCSHCFEDWDGMSIPMIGWWLTDMLFISLVLGSHDPKLVGMPHFHQLMATWRVFKDGFNWDVGQDDEPMQDTTGGWET